MGNFLWFCEALGVMKGLRRLMHNGCSIWSILEDVINILSLDNCIYMAYVIGTKTPAKVVNVNARQLAIAPSGIWCRPRETLLRHSHVY